MPCPGWDEFEAEMRQQGPTVQVVVRGADGTVINRVDGPTSTGVHRVNWELDYAPSVLIGLEGGGGFGGGHRVLPGRYTAELVKIEEGEVTELVPIRSEVERMEGEVERLEEALRATGAPPIEGGGAAEDAAHAHRPAPCVSRRSAGTVSAADSSI